MRGYSTLQVNAGKGVLGDQVDEGTDDRRSLFGGRETSEPFDDYEDDHVAEGAEEEDEFRKEDEEELDPVFEEDAVEAFEEDADSHVDDSHDDRRLHFEGVQKRD